MQKALKYLVGSNESSVSHTLHIAISMRRTFRRTTDIDIAVKLNLSRVNK